MNNRPAVQGLILLLAMSALTATAAEPFPEATPESSKTTDSVAATSAAAPTTRIWECTTNGVRTFSSNPCGTKSTVRELNPLNVMQPAPLYRTTRTYSPAPQASAAPNYSYPSQTDSDELSADSAYNAAYNNSGVIVVPRLHRVHPRSRNHPHPNRR
jgi:hypothetical protein